MKIVLSLFFIGAFFNCVLGQTPINGIVNTHITLAKSSSPYLVSNLVISSDGKITVEPGVEVRFANGGKLEVRGDLVAIGTAADSIVFTSNATSPTSASWAGVIILNPQGATAQFKYTKFSYASAAITETCCWGGTVSIKNSSFTHNTTALNGYGGNITAVDSCSFSYNTYAVTQADKNIKASVFDHNDYGLYNTERVDVTNSSFTNHSQVALLGGRGVIKNAIIENNNIGVKAFYEGFDILSSSISNNSVGIYLGDYDGFMPPIDSSKICNNSLYNVINTSNVSVELYTNCWCTADSTVIEDKIFDGWDDSSRGLIDYTLIINDCETAVYNTLKAEGRVTYLNTITEVEDPRNNAISFHPNPASSQLYITNSANVRNLRIITVEGQQLYEINRFSNDGLIDIGTLRPGLYLLVVTDKTGRQKTEKLLVKH